MLAVVPAHAQEVIELTGEDRWLEADFQELYRIGTLTGEEWEQFGDVYDVAFDGTGNLHVIDTQSDRVFVVGSDGRLIRELGGKGDGPGEFGNSIAMAVMADGRVVVVDMSRHGYHLFGPDGEFQHMVGMDGNPSITTRPKISEYGPGGRFWLCGVAFAARLPLGKRLEGALRAGRCLFPVAGTLVRRGVLVPGDTGPRSGTTFATRRRGRGGVTGSRSARSCSRC